MSGPDYHGISRKELEQRFKEQTPDNDSNSDGYALVNVLDPDLYERQHIVNSINIPRSELGKFEQRYDRDKEIIVYCASRECETSAEVARELLRRGFRNVYRYEKGLEDWKAAGNATSGSEA